MKRLLIDIEPPYRDWRRDAACVGHDPDLFYPLSERDAGRAKRICASCPVSLECLATVLNMPPHERYGVWAGRYFKDHHLTRKESPHAQRAAI